MCLVFYKSWVAGKQCTMYHSKIYIHNPKPKHTNRHDQTKKDLIHRETGHKVVPTWAIN